MWDAAINCCLVLSIATIVENMILIGDAENVTIEETNMTLGVGTAIEKLVLP